MKVGMILLGEAGNYGDDLILLAVLHSLAKHDPGIEPAFLSFGNQIPLGKIGKRFTLPLKVKRARSIHELPGSKFHLKQLERADLIIIGGGGLIQTSQDALKPFHWLRHLPSTSAPVVGMGLGLGPLDDRWIRFFRQQPSPFDVLYVRDPYSIELAEDFGWSPRLANDFIDDIFIAEFIDACGRPPVSQDRVLGVALRAWPGLSAQSVAEHIEEVARRHNIQRVEYFVLESKDGAGPDVEFTNDVAARVSINTSEIYVYRSENILEFTRSMLGVSVAISMKLHSSAVWGAFQVPMYPIIYAPKISDYFGLDYKGLQVISEPIQPAEPCTSLRSEEALLEVLVSSLIENRDSAQKLPFFSGGNRFRLQLETLFTVLNKRVARMLQKRKVE